MDRQLRAARRRFTKRPHVGPQPPGRRIKPILAALESPISGMATLCQHAALDDIGAVAYAADIAQMAHETLSTRIFRS